MKIALVCIAKNEDNYIKEWIDYHKKIGFDNIYIYENNWRCKINESNVIKIPFDGNIRQLSAYNHFINHFRNKYQWAAFFDIDEFLVLKQHKNIKEFISDYKSYPAVGINWVLFGDNHLTNIHNNEYSLIKRFTKRQININRHIKTIINLNYLHKFINPHHTNLYSMSAEKTIIRGPYNYNGSDNIAQLNHYFVKTKEEFISKINRGRADVYFTRPTEEFDEHNFNDIEDLTAYKFMYG
jgi:hypothetical protein